MTITIGTRDIQKLLEFSCCNHEYNVRTNKSLTTEEPDILRKAKGIQKIKCTTFYSTNYKDQSILRSDLMHFCGAIVQLPLGGLDFKFGVSLGITTLLRSVNSRMV